MFSKRSEKPKQCYQRTICFHFTSRSWRCEGGFVKVYAGASIRAVSLTFTWRFDKLQDRALIDKSVLPLSERSIRRHHLIDVKQLWCMHGNMAAFMMYRSRDHPSNPSVAKRRSYFHKLHMRVCIVLARRLREKAGTTVGTHKKLCAYACVLS